ncbi:MAG: TlpA family protein disulfide reductase [Acidimicrobiales bacterium]
MALSLVGALVLFGAVGLFWPVGNRSASGTGTTVPASIFTTGKAGPARGFTLPVLGQASRTVSLADFAGRPLVINFWSSTCGPCKAEMPALESVYRSMGGRVAFLGVDTGDSQADAVAFARSKGVTYPSGFDPSTSVATSYDLYGLPHTVFISPTGQILESHTGPLDVSGLTSSIHRLFPLLRP